MVKIARSMRGQVVDFDLLDLKVIKKQISGGKISSSTAERRRFIDEKEQVKTRSVSLEVNIPNAESQASSTKKSTNKKETNESSGSE